MNNIQEEIQLKLAVTLSEIRDKITQADYKEPIPAKFKALRLKHKKELDALNLKFEGVVERCKTNKSDPEKDLEYIDVKNSLSQALELLNRDCMGELADSSGAFLVAIAEAHSHFIENLVNLATVWEVEERVNFDSIKEMFINWRENTVASIHLYMKHGDILLKFTDEDARNQQIMRHRNAAVMCDCSPFNEVAGSVGYDVLPAPFHKINVRNVKAIDRARDFLTSFSILTFKNPFTWELVKFRNTGDIPKRFLEHSDHGVYSEQAKQMVTAKLKTDIAKISGDSFLLICSN
jgi:hypothetical protein